MSAEIELLFESRVATLRIATGQYNWLRARHFQALRRLLREALERHAEVIVVSSGSPDAFSVGCDVRTDDDRIDAQDLVGSYVRFVRDFLHAPAITVALVDGKCLGGGLELALACDFIVASPRSTFALPEALVGCAPPVAMALFPMRTSRPNAARAMLLGERYSPQQALDDGWVAVVTSEDFDREARAFVADIAKESRGSVAAAIRRGTGFRPGSGFSPFGIEYSDGMATRLDHQAVAAVSAAVLRQLAARAQILDTLEVQFRNSLTVYAELLNKGVIQSGMTAFFTEREHPVRGTVPPPPVFVSYNRDDSVVVLRIVELLRGRGVEVFVDVETPGGVNWQETLTAHIARARCCLFFVGARFSRWQQTEFEQAYVQEAAAWVPVRLAPGERLSPTVPAALMERQAIDWTDDEVSLVALHEAIARALLGGR